MRLVGLAEGDGGQVVAEIHLDDGEVGVRIGADDVSLGRAAIGERHFDLVGGFHHMVVGENVTVMADDDAGTQAGALLRGIVVELVAEEETEARVIHEGRCRAFSLRCW